MSSKQPNPVETIDTSKLFEPKGRPQPPPRIGFFESTETTDQGGPDEMYQSAMKAAKTAKNAQDMAQVLVQLTKAADRGHMLAAPAWRAPTTTAELAEANDEEDSGGTAPARAARSTGNGGRSRQRSGGSSHA
jgi:hypothetical protein